MTWLTLIAIVVCLIKAGELIGCAMEKMFHVEEDE